MAIRLYGQGRRKARGMRGQPIKKKWKDAGWQD
jgi:hypothetical protein